MRAGWLGLLAAILVVACGAGPAARAPGVADPAAVRAFDAIRPGGPLPVGVRSGAEAIVYYPAVDGAAGPPPPGPGALPEIDRRFGPDAGATLAAASGPGRAGLAARAGRYPLILFMPGAGLASRDYRLLLAELASHGTIVVALRPDSSPSPAPQAYRDTAAALAQAAGHWPNDPSLRDHVAPGGPLLVGHSMGGAGAVLALAQVPTARGAVNLDGDWPGELAAPAPPRAILYLTGDESGDPDSTRQRRARDWRTVAGANPAARRVAIAGMRHLDLLDAASLPAPLLAEARSQGRVGAGDPARLRQQLARAILALAKVTGS